MGKVPLEIWQVILSEFCLHCQYATNPRDEAITYGADAQHRYDDLMSLCKSSRFLRNRAQPVLFHNVTIRSFYRAVLFIRTLLTNSVGAQCRYLDFRLFPTITSDNRSHEHAAWSDDEGYYDALRSITKVARQRLPGGLPTSWPILLEKPPTRHELTAGSHVYGRPLLALILSLIAEYTGTKELVIGAVPHLFRQFEVGRTPKGEKPPRLPDLSGLQKLTIIATIPNSKLQKEKSDIPFPLAVQPAPFVALCHGLKTLELSASTKEFPLLKSLEYLPARPKGVYGLHSITTLTLTRCAFSYKHFRSMMTLLGPNLQHFLFTTPIHIKTKKNLQLSTILHMLKSHKRTLKSLVVECWRAKDDRIPFTDAVKDLVETFSNIERVKIGVVRSETIMNHQGDIVRYLDSGRAEGTEGLCLELLAQTSVLDKQVSYFHRPGMLDTHLVAVKDALAGHIATHVRESHGLLGLPGSSLMTPAGMSIVNMDIFEDSEATSDAQSLHAAQIDDFSEAGIDLAFKEIIKGPLGRC